METRKTSKEIEEEDRMARSDDDDNDNDNTGVGRTYECSYCKRGFTNAQALGGHMNMHRRDKAKAKHPTFSSFSSSISSYRPVESSNGAYPSNFAPQRNYQTFYNPLANPMPSRMSTYIGNNSEFPIRRSSLFGMCEDHLGADLSLKINSSSMEYHHQESDQERKKRKDENYDTIDLELRLGPKAFYSRPYPTEGRTYRCSHLVTGNQEHLTRWQRSGSWRFAYK